VRAVICLLALLLASCDDEEQQQSSGSSDPNAIQPGQAAGCPPSIPLGDASWASGGPVTAAIDTDGDPSEQGRDATWQAQTSSDANSAQVPFIVMSQAQLNASGVQVGDWARVSNPANGESTWAIVGDKGPESAVNGGEISEKAAENVGIAFTSNSDTVGNPQIVVQSWADSSGVQANCGAPTQTAQN
jgi:hypothetical protein